MNRSDLAEYLTGFLRSADFAARAADEAHGWVLDWLPYAAAHGYLHTLVGEGAVWGLAIAGPIPASRLLGERRPERLRPDAFTVGGDVLLGQYLFVDPARRGNREGLNALRTAAHAAFPETASWAYTRPARGLSVRPFRAVPVIQPEVEEIPDGFDE